MMCALCVANSGEYDLKKLCCAVRHIDDVSRATMRRLVNKAVQLGHDEADIRAGLAERRRQERRPVPGEAAR